jgi:hypothetical protein
MSQGSEPAALNCRHKYYNWQLYRGQHSRLSGALVYLREVVKPSGLSFSARLPTLHLLRAQTVLERRQKVVTSDWCMMVATLSSICVIPHGL